MEFAGDLEDEVVHWLRALHVDSRVSTLDELSHVVGSIFAVNPNRDGRTCKQEYSEQGAGCEPHVRVPFHLRLDARQYVLRSS